MDKARREAIAKETFERTGKILDTSDANQGFWELVEGDYSAPLKRLRKHIESTPPPSPFQARVKRIKRTFKHTFNYVRGTRWSRFVTVCVVSQFLAITLLALKVDFADDPVYVFFPLLLLAATSLGRWILVGGGHD